MNTLDIIILAIIGLFTVLGFFTGFIRGVSSLVGIAAGIVAGNLFHASGAGMLSPFIASPEAANVVAYALILIITMAVVALAARVLERVINLMFLGWLNRLLGLVLGFAKGGVLAALFLLLLTLILPPHHEFIAKSLLRPYFEYAYAVVPDNFRQQLVEKKEAIESYLKEKATR